MKIEEINEILEKEQIRVTPVISKDASYYFKLGYSDGYDAGVAQGIIFARKLLEKDE
jgi:hypothetical protein